MKKIGILTYHRVFNFGSLLQTYALQRYLENKGQAVEVIDYYPERLQKKKIVVSCESKVEATNMENDCTFDSCGDYKITRISHDGYFFGKVCASNGESL